MRYRLFFSLENVVLPIDYRRYIISFIKNALSSYDEEHFQMYYNNKDNLIKPYAFSVFFNNFEISENKIIVNDKKMEMNITMADYDSCIYMYNSFSMQRNKKFSINQNSWTLKNIELIPEKEIKRRNCVVKFQSPLCARLRENDKDYYFSYKHEQFENILKMNIKNQLKITNFSAEIVDTFKIKPIDAKKVIIKFYEKCIECSTGTFELEGEISLLNYLYKAGIGSKHSAGFGMFQVIY